MPYDWTTGQYTATPQFRPAVLPGYGPRQPNLVGVGASVAPRPKYPTMQVGPMGRTVPYDPSLYKKPAVGGPPKPIPVKKAPVNPYDQLIAQIRGLIETPAQQEARVNREINAQIAAQKKMYDDEAARQQRDAMAAFQAQSLAGAAAAAMNKDLFGAVGGEYNAAASEIKGLAHGLSKNAAGATAGDVSAANAALGALGNAPVTQGGSFGVGGETQRGVEDYRGGTLPGQMFTTQGEAENFGLAGLIGSQYGKANAEATAALLNAQKDIRDNQAKAMDSLASGRLDLYHQYMSDANDNKIKYVSLMQGLIAQKASDQTARAKVAASLLKPQLRTVGHDLYQLNPATGQWKKVIDVTDPQKQPTNTGPYFRDPVTGNYVLKPGYHLDPKSGQPTKDVTPPKLTNTGPWIRDPRTGGWTLKPGYSINAQGKVVKDPKAGKGPTPATLTKAERLVDEWFYGTVVQKGSTTPVAANKVPGFDPNNPTYGNETTRKKYSAALSQLQRMGISRNAARNMLNERYQRGDLGRPLLSSEERNVARKHYGAHKLDRILMTINSLFDSGDADKESQGDLILNKLLALQPIRV